MNIISSWNGAHEQTTISNNNIILLSIILIIVIISISSSSNSSNSSSRPAVAPWHPTLPLVRGVSDAAQIKVCLSITVYISLSLYTYVYIYIYIWISLYKTYCITNIFFLTKSDMFFLWQGV